jgi:putative tricarboxylic transport membrane protein
MRLGRDGWAGLICIVVSLALLVQSINLPKLPLTPVGPGFYPNILLTLLALAGLGLLAQDLLASRAAATASATGPSQVFATYGRVFLVFVVVGIYVLLLPLLGFRLATVVFLAMLQPAIEWPTSFRQWSIVAAVALITPLATFIVFERYLLVLLPRGSWTGW